MKTKSRNPRASTGGASKQQPDLLMQQVELMDTRVPRERPRMSRRLQEAIARFRWFICGQFGALKEEVTDAHVAALVERVIEDFSFMYRHFHGIGGTTCDELAAWAKGIRSAR